MELPAMHESDEQLLVSMRAGDQSAVAKLYDRHGGAVFGMARRMLRAPELAEEVVQDTFVKAWRRCATYDATRASAMTWLMSIAHNCAVDRLRRESSRALGHSVELQEHDATDQDSSDAREVGGQKAPNPADVAVVTDRATIVRETLKKIPPRQREAIELAYFSGLSQTEVATRLGEPVGTIKTRMFHGMRRLRDLLDAAGVRDEA